MSKFLIRVSLNVVRQVLCHSAWLLGCRVPGKAKGHCSALQGLCEYSNPTRPPPAPPDWLVWLLSPSLTFNSPRAVAANLPTCWFLFGRLGVSFGFSMFKTPSQESLGNPFSGLKVTQQNFSFRS